MKATRFIVLGFLVASLADRDIDKYVARGLGNEYDAPLPVFGCFLGGIDKTQGATGCRPGELGLRDWPTHGLDQYLDVGLFAGEERAY